MSISTKFIEEYLGKSRVAINNALELTDIKERLLNHGYDETRLQEGKKMYEEAFNLLNEFKAAHAEQVGITKTLNKEMKKAYSTYMDYAKMARFAVEEDDGLIELLQLDGQRGTRQEAWTGQAIRFYQEALKREDILQKLGVFAITKEKLEAGLALVKEALSLDSKQENKKGIAQQLITRRDKSFRKHTQWMSPFKQACRIEFKDDPQNIERLKIDALSDGYVRKKKKKKDDNEPKTEETENQTV